MFNISIFSCFDIFEKAKLSPLKNKHKIFEVYYKIFLSRYVNLLYSFRKY